MNQGTNLGSQKGRWIILAALVAVLGALLFWLPGVQAQQNLQVVEYDENGTGAVITLSASDPEGVAPVVWSLLPAIGTPAEAIGGTDLTADDIADRDEFNISQGGVLTFKTPPSYEDSSASGNKNYQVVVQATDRGEMMHRNWFKVTVKVEDLEELGKVTLSHLQPQVGVVMTASVTDPDGPAAITATGWKWYRSSNMNGPWTEINGATAETYTPKDDAGDDDRNKYLRAVATYDDARPAEYGTKEAMGVSAHRVDPERENNTAPTFRQTAVDRNIPENTKAGVKIGAPVAATDPDSGDVLVYALGTATDCATDENACFDIDRATGQLMTKEKLDSDTKDSYEVMVTATDSSNIATATAATVTISITDIDEAPTFQMGSVTAKDIMENASGEALMVGTYTGTDPEGGTVTLSLSGADMSKFELTDPDPAAAGSKVLSFKGKPDYEARADSNKDNVYEVMVEASDGSNVGKKNVTVKVTNVDEDGKVTLSGGQPAIGTEITATLADEDGFVPDTVAWTWHRLVAETASAAADEAADANNAIDKATMATYTPVAADDGKFLKAMASYADMTFDMTKMETSDASAKVAVDPGNKRPMFDDGSSTDRYVMEGTGGPDDTPTIIAGPVGATDANRDSLAYTLGGADAGSFMMVADDPDTTDVNEHDGSIRVKAGVKLDHEKKNRYTVTVAADDGRGESNSTARITATIHVTDMDEKPMIFEGGLSITGPTGSVGYMENSDVATVAVGTYTATGSDAADAKWTRKGADADAFTVEGSGESVMLKFRSSPDYEMPADADGDNVYEVTLEANDGTYMATHHVKVSVTNEDEDGTVTIDSESPVVGIAVTAVLSDPDGGETGITWMWASAGSDGTYNDINGADSETYTPGADDVGMTLRATASYNDAQGTGKSAMDVTDNAVVELEVTGDSSVTIEENVTTAGTYTSSVSGATWSLSGDDAGQFSIPGGVLTFNTAPDFENPADTGADNVYNVTVVATYGAVSDDLDVTVTVTDVEEGPVQRYDGNGDGAISVGELFVAIDAYFAEEISISELFEVIDAYFAS